MEEGESSGGQNYRLTVDEETAGIFQIGFAIQPFRSRITVRQRNRRLVIPTFQVEKGADARICALS